MYWVNASPCKYVYVWDSSVISKCKIEHAFTPSDISPKPPSCSEDFVYHHFFCLKEP